jgi:hypothetical protein
MTTSITWMRWEYGQAVLKRISLNPETFLAYFIILIFIDLD